MTAVKTNPQSVFRTMIGGFAVTPARRVLTKAKDFVLAPVRQAWTVAAGAVSRVTVWAKANRKLLIWVAIASAIVLAAGIILAYLYFTKPRFRGFVQSVGAAVRTRSSFRPPKPVIAQVPFPANAQAEEIPARQSANTPAPAL
jgi:hypothetical protein